MKNTVYIIDYTDGQRTVHGPFRSVEFYAIQTTTPQVDPIAIIYRALTLDSDYQRVTVSQVHSIVSDPTEEEE